MKKFIKRLWIGVNIILFLLFGPFNLVLWVITDLGFFSRYSDYLIKLFEEETLLKE